MNALLLASIALLLVGCLNSESTEGNQQIVHQQVVEVEPAPEFNNNKAEPEVEAKLEAEAEAKLEAEAEAKLEAEAEADAKPEADELSNPVISTPPLILVEPATAQVPEEREVAEKEEGKELTPEVNLKGKELSTDFSKLPPNAAEYLPILRTVIDKKWPTFHTPSIFAALTEKESCKTLKHPKCWTPYAELKTKREYGFGFGQLTIAYDAKGKVRFNKFEEMKLLDSDLRDWNFADRFNAEKQFIALIVLNQINYKALAKLPTKTETDKVAMMLAAYNGGLGGVTSDIKLCRTTAGCDPERWFGHVEKTTRKSKVKFNGYGSSVADINRLYPFDILYTRRDKYLPHFDDSLIHPKLAVAPHKF